MHVKTFEGLNIKDAVKAVKREFGQNAVILSTQEKTFPDDPNAKMVEVRAAVPENYNRSGASEGLGGLPRFEGLGAQKIGDIDRQLSTLIKSVPSKTSVQHLETGLHEIKLLLLETLRGREGSAIRKLPPHLFNIDRMLRAMRVDDVYIADLMKHLSSLNVPTKEKEGGEAALEEYYRSMAIRWMLKKVKIAPVWTVMDGSVSVHGFMGPAGVGKTTLVAKLAAQYQLKKGKKVLIVSFDPIRLAATEQLRIYSKIVDVPFVSISAPEELSQKLLDHRDVELVLIDTAGYATKDSEHLNRLEQLRALSIPLDMHLVLSSTEREEQMDRMVRLLSPVGIQSLSFTKFDESWSFGSVFNMSQRWTLPLSFFSTGPDIPADIERATKERVVERIFGL